MTGKLEQGIFSTGETCVINVAWCPHQFDFTSHL